MPEYIEEKLHTEEGQRVAACILEPEESEAWDAYVADRRAELVAGGYGGPFNEAIALRSIVRVTLAVWGLFKRPIDEVPSAPPGEATIAASEVQ